MPQISIIHQSSWTGSEKASQEQRASASGLPSKFRLPQSRQIITRRIAIPLPQPAIAASLSKRIVSPPVPIEIEPSSASRTPKQRKRHANHNEGEKIHCNGSRANQLRNLDRPLNQPANHHKDGDNEIGSQRNQAQPAMPSPDRPKLPPRIPTPNLKFHPQNSIAAAFACFIGGSRGLQASELSRKVGRDS